MFLQGLSPEALLQKKTLAASVSPSGLSWTETHWPFFAHRTVLSLEWTWSSNLVCRTVARSRTSWGSMPQDCCKGSRRIRGKREFESGIMKQFTIDLITVKSHSNHRGANKGNPLNITRGKKKIKMLKSKQPVQKGQQISFNFVFSNIYHVSFSPTPTPPWFNRPDTTACFHCSYVE